MLRRKARLRREYLFRKSAEDKFKNFQDKKDQIKRSLEQHIPIHGDLKADALDLQNKLKWSDKGSIYYICTIFWDNSKFNKFYF